MPMKHKVMMASLFGMLLVVLCGCSSTSARYHAAFIGPPSNGWYRSDGYDHRGARPAPLFKRHSNTVAARVEKSVVPAPLEVKAPVLLAEVTQSTPIADALQPSQQVATDVTSASAPLATAVRVAQTTAGSPAPLPRVEVKTYPAADGSLAYSASVNKNPWTLYGDVSVLAGPAITPKNGNLEVYARARADLTLSKNEVAVSLHHWSELWSYERERTTQFKQYVCYPKENRNEYWSRNSVDNMLDWNGRTLIGLGPGRESVFYGLEAFAGVWSHDGGLFDEYGGGLLYSRPIIDGLNAGFLVGATTENAFRSDLVLDYRTPGRGLIVATAFAGGRVDYDGNSGLGAGGDVGIDLLRLRSKPSPWSLVTGVGARWDDGHWRDQSQGSPDAYYPNPLGGPGGEVHSHSLASFTSEQPKTTTFAFLKIGRSF